MREIIFLQIGNSGNQIGARFWDTISNEHSIGPTGKILPDHNSSTDMLDVYYNQTANEKYVPRAILADLDSDILNNMRVSPQGRRFNPSNFIYGQYGAGNCFGQGFYVEDKNLVERFYDKIRQEIEQCDCLQGFQLAHSMIGGTGSGLGSLLLYHLSEEYPDKISHTFSVCYPTMQHPDVVVEPYNTILSLQYLIENAEGVYVFDDQTLIDISMRSPNIIAPNYQNVNAIIANAMSDATCSLRFSGQINSDMQRLSINLVPFHRLHFFTVGLSHASLGKPTDDEKCLSVPELTNRMFKPRNQLTPNDIRKGNYLGAFGIFRGGMLDKEVDDQIIMLKKKNSGFEKCRGENIKGSVCGTTPRDLKASSVLIGNHCSIGNMWKNVEQKFDKLFRRKYFLKPFEYAGMYDLEFMEAQSNVLDLISEYQESDELLTVDSE